MNKWIENFRKTSAYKIFGYISGPTLLLCLLAFIFAISINVGMAGMFSMIIMFVITIVLTLLLFLFLIFSVIAFLQSSKVQKDAKTNLLADICWSIILILFLFPNIFYQFEPQEKKVRRDLSTHSYKIDSFINYQDKDYENNGNDIAAVFARYYKDQLNIKGVEGNKVITKNNIFEFNIEGSCEDGCNVRIYYTKPSKFYIEKKVKYIKTAQGYRYSSLDAGIIKDSFKETSK